MTQLLQSRRRLLGAALVVAAALVLGARFLLHAGAAEQAPPTALLPPVPPARPALVVDVAGAVRRPGLYRLPPGARVADAIARAGGAARQADVVLVNLAAPLADGQQVVVPARATAATPGGAVGPGPSAPAGPLHLSTASVEQLDSLPGVGPVTAGKIIEYRQRHGPFRSVEELDAIPGIGPARIDQLRDLVTP